VYALLHIDVSSKVELQVYTCTPLLSIAKLKACRHTVVNYVQIQLKLPLQKVCKCLEFIPGVTRDIFIDHYLPPAPSAAS
jgi:hypothetical protein